PNLIKNGGFEQNFNSNGIGVHYEYNPSWFPPNSSATMIFQEEECDVYEGFYSQKITIENIPEYAYFFQNFKGKPNAIYKVSAWVKSNDEIELSFTLRNRRVYEPKISSTVTKKISENWEKIEIIGGMGSHGGLLSETDDNFDFFIKFLSTGNLLIDNISVVDVTDVIVNQRIAEQIKSSPVPKNFFGLHLNKLKSSNDTNPNAHTLWPDLNFGMLRLWDSGTRWSEIEHQEGQFYLDRVNLCVDKRDTSDESTDIIMTLGSSPKWAAASIEDNFMGLNFYTSISDIHIWEEYVTTLGEEYNQRIEYWEIWNEVEHFFKESANVDLIELSRTAYTALKNINPQFKILSPNFTSSEAASNFLYSFKETYLNKDYP